MCQSDFFGQYMPMHRWNIDPLVRQQLAQTKVNYSSKLYGNVTWVFVRNFTKKVIQKNTSLYDFLRMMFWIVSVYVHMVRHI